MAAPQKIILESVAEPIPEKEEDRSNVQTLEIPEAQSPSSDAGLEADIDNLLADLALDEQSGDERSDDEDIQEKLEKIRKAKELQAKAEQEEKDRLLAQLMSAEENLKKLESEQAKAEATKNKPIKVTFCDRELGLYIVEGNRCFVVSNVGRGTTAHQAGVYPNMILQRIMWNNKPITASNLSQLHQILKNPAVRPLDITFVDPTGINKERYLSQQPQPSAPPKCP